MRFTQFPLRGPIPTLAAPALQVFVVAALLASAATPAHALSGKLGAQIFAIGNQLTGTLPEEGRWSGQSSLGYGIVAELDVKPAISISFQPSYTPRNAVQQFKSNGVVVAQTDYEINYLSLPLLVRVTGDGVKTRGFVTAGLNLNILLDAQFDEGQGPVDNTDDYDSTTLGALFGAGVIIPLGRNPLTIELRYDQGLDDLIARDGSESGNAPDSPSVKYRGLSLIVGYLFSIGGGD